MAVFAPIMLMGGIIGRLFREFAVVLASAVLVSMLVSLTTTPMMCAQMLRPFGEEVAARKRRLLALKNGSLSFAARFWMRLGQWWGHALDGMHTSYKNSLAKALNYPRLGIFFLLVVVAGNIWLYIVIPKGFFPEQDTGIIMGGLKADQSSSYQALSLIHI